MPADAARVALRLEDAYEDLEFWYPYYRLKEAGCEVTVIGTGEERYAGKNGLSATEDVSVDEVSAADFDAVEINGRHFDRLGQVRELAETMDLPVVGGSDAHYPFEAGRAFTLIEATKLTPESVVDAIRDGRVEPVIRDWHRDRIMQTGYGFVHRYL
jgi:hypothetical protein